MTFIQVDEYGLAIVMWVLSAIVLLSKAIHWTGFTGSPGATRLLKVLYIICALAFILLSVTWTNAKKGDKAWTSFMNKGTHIHDKSAERATSDDDSRTYHAGLIFKETPSLNKHSKALLADYAEEFYSYLVSVGISPPTGIPIGIEEPLGLGGCGTASWLPAPGSIYIIEPCINNKLAFQELYGDYVFHNLVSLILHDESYNDRANRFRAPSILAQYYFSSLHDKLDSSERGVYPWVSALWDIRQQCGQTFIDRSLPYAIKSMNSDTKYKKGLDFNAYFTHHLEVGFSTIDNQGKKQLAVVTILRLHKLFE